MRNQSTLFLSIPPPNRWTDRKDVLWIMAMLAMDINGSYYSKQTVFRPLISFLDSFNFLVK
jgi:hypothetical protein